MHEYLNYLENREKDYREKKELYIKEIISIAKKYGGRAYMFGSQIKEESLPGSDIDILVEIPDNVDRINVLLELRKTIKNRKFQFHVLNSSEANLFKKMLDKYIDLDSSLLNKNH